MHPNYIKPNKDKPTKTKTSTKIGFIYKILTLRVPGKLIHEIENAEHKDEYTDWVAAAAV